MILDAFTYSIMTVVAILSFVIIYLARSEERSRDDSEN